MNNNIDGQINTLNELTKGGINEDKFHHEFKDVFNTLESIKEEADKGGATKEQLNKIIAFLNQQINTIPNGDFNAVNKLTSYKNDFQNLLSNFKKETYNIHNESRKSNKELSVIVDQAVANGQVTDGIPSISKNTTAKKVLKAKPQINFSNNEKQNFESHLDLNNLTSYTVKSGDNLWNIVKKQYPNIAKSNKDIIHIVNYIVNLNTKLNPQKLKHLMRDDKLAWGKKGSDGIAGDKLRIGDILKFPKIKSNETIIKPTNDVLDSNEIEQKLKIEKRVLIIKAEQIQDKHIRSEILKEINKCTNKQCLSKIRDDINKLIAKQEGIGTVETRFYFKTVGFTQNGENYIIGKDGEPKLITTQELTPEYKETLKEYKETLLLTENINLLLSALTQNGEDVSKFSTQLKNKINSFNPLKLKKSVNEIKTTINSIFNNLDIDNKKEIDLKSTISIYKYIRNELDNYELVRKQIAEKEFNNLTQISPKELDAFIKKPTSTQEKIKNILGEEGFKDFQKDVIKKEAEASTYYIEHLEELQKQFPSLDVKSIESLVINSFVGNYSKIALMEAYIQTNMMKENSFIGSEYNGNGNENIDLFADIQGIGTYDFSDKTTNIGIEGAKLIGTEIIAILAGMVTMGAGTYAINAAVYGTRLVKYAKLTEKSFSALNIGGKALKVGKFAAMSTIEGGSFYAGYAGMQSGIEGKNMYTTEGLYQSVAFMGAFKALNGLYKAAGLTLDTAKPLMQQKLILGKQLIGEGITFSALGLEFEGILFEPGEWTAETIIQAFVMAAAFKGAGLAAGKYKFRQTKEGKVEAIKEETGEVFVHKNGKEYIKGTDGKYRDSEGKIKNINTKYLKKKINYKWSTEAHIDKNIKPLNSDGTLKKSKGPKNPENTNNSISRYEKKRFEKKLLNKFEDKESVTLTNSKGEAIIINKESNGKYTFKNDVDSNGNLNLYSKKEMLKKIDNDFKIKLLEDLNYDSILKTVEGEEIVLGRKLGIPGTGKLKILKGGEIEMNGKIIKDKAKIKEILSNPKIRTELLKKKLDNMTIAELSEKLSNLKGWEKFKGLSEGAKKIAAERLVSLLKSGIYGGLTTTILHELLTDRDEGTSTTDRLAELAVVFATGAGGGIALSLMGSGGMLIWSAGKGAIKAGWKNAVVPITKFVSEKKVWIAGIGTVSVISYNILKD